VTRPSRGRGLWCGLDGGEDLQGVVVEVVHLAGDESFGVSFGAGGAADGGAGVGGRQDTLGGAAPRGDALVVGP
jgi:hypothetical protein